MSYWDKEFGDDLKRAGAQRKRAEIVDRCHGCKRDLPDGVSRLMVSSFEGFRQWCEDCQRKGKHR